MKLAEAVERSPPLESGIRLRAREPGKPVAYLHQPRAVGHDHQSIGHADEHDRELPGARLRLRRTEPDQGGGERAEPQPWQGGELPRTPLRAMSDASAQQRERDRRRRDDEARTTASGRRGSRCSRRTQLKQRGPATAHGQDGPAHLLHTPASTGSAVNRRFWPPSRQPHGAWQQ